MAELIATARWTEKAWEAVICIPGLKAVWRGGTFADWNAAVAQAEKELALRK